MFEIVLAAGLLLAGLPQTPCNAECEWRLATELLRQGDTRAAVERLKEARGRFPDDRRGVLLLARSYLLENNLFWAERTLLEGLAQWPDDPELHAWLAAVHLRQGDPDLALDDLDPEILPGEDPARARWRLLDATRAQLDGDRDEAVRLLNQVTRSESMWPEDRRALANLRSGLDPWWRRPITGTLEFGPGYTSNALAGSPTDPGSSGDPSGLGLVELRGRFVPPTGKRLRPAFELEVLGNGLSNDEYSELSTLSTGLRLGGVVFGGKRTLYFGYRAEALFLNQEESRYADAHRMEVELEWIGGRVVFAGAGHRSYRDERRTRWEGDLGIGGPLHLSSKIPVIAGATLRLADAQSPAYDQLGLSAAASAVVPLGRRTDLWVALAGIWDEYPSSGGLEGWLVFGTREKRRDLLGRIGATLWAPGWRGLRPGFELRYTRRDSTADERPGFDFSYREWRAVAWLRWTFSADPWAPKRATDTDHVPLDWGLTRGNAMDQERILDLLRRDEELRRGSSCSLP